MTPFDLQTQWASTIYEDKQSPNMKKLALEPGTLPVFADFTTANVQVF